MLTRVYILTFPNGKIYVGKTVKLVGVRLFEHWRDYRKGFPVQQAVRFYGMEKVASDVLFESDDVEIVRLLEAEEIDARGSRDRLIGYNVARGGDGGDILSTLSPERFKLFKERHSAGIKRAFASPERRAKSSMPGAKNPMYGRTHTEAVRRAQSERRKGVKLELTQEQQRHWSHVRSVWCQARSKFDKEEWQKLRAELLSGAPLRKTAECLGLSPSLLKQLRRGQHWSCDGSETPYDGLLQPRRHDLLTEQQKLNRARLTNASGRFERQSWQAIRRDIKNGLGIKGAMSKYGLKQTTAEKLSSGNHWSCLAIQSQDLVMAPPTQV